MLRRQREGYIKQIIPMNPGTSHKVQLWRHKTFVHRQEEPDGGPTNKEKSQPISLTKMVLLTLAGLRFF